MASSFVDPQGFGVPPPPTRTVASVGTISVGAGAAGSASAGFSVTFTRAVVIATRFGFTNPTVNFSASFNAMLNEGVGVSHTGAIDGIAFSNFTGAVTVGAAINHTGRSHNPGIPVTSTSVNLFVQSTIASLSIGCRVDAEIEVP